MSDYARVLRDWKVSCAPQSSAEAPNERFVEACHKLDQTEYYLDILCTGDSYERAEVIQQQMADGKLDRLRQRLEKIHKEETEDGYSAELDKALDEYAELKAQAADFDPVELYKARQVIRPALEKAVKKQLEDTMQEKPSLIVLLSAKQEASRLLGEDTEDRQVRQLIMRRQKEQRTVPQNQSKKKEHWER